LQCRAEAKDYYSKAGSTGYKKAGHQWRDGQHFETRIERKTMMTQARNHTIKSKALYLFPSFVRELSWLHMRGGHHVDPSIIVFGGGALDDIKVEALQQLNSDPLLAATTTRFTIIIDHGQDRMRAHIKFRDLIFTRPPWAVSGDIVENMDVFEMDFWVETGELPFRFQTVHHQLRVSENNRCGAACVMDLGTNAEHPASRTSIDLFSQLKFTLTNLLYSHGNVTDARGDLAMGFLQVSTFTKLPPAPPHHIISHCIRHYLTQHFQLSHSSTLSSHPISGTSSKDPC
jgi:hypothetical protein